MGKVVKQAIPLAVGALVPMALPTVSPIITGALSGAISSAVTGGNPLLGAATGALGGAVSSAIGGGGGGLFGAPTATPVTSSPVASAAPLTPSITGVESSLLMGDLGGPISSVATISPTVSAATSAIDPTLGDAQVLDVGSVPYFDSYDYTLDAFEEPLTAGLATPQGTSGATTAGVDTPTTASGGGGLTDFLKDNKGEIFKTGAKLLGGFLSEEDEAATAPERQLASQQARLAQTELGAAQAQLDRRNRAATEIMGLSRSFDPEGAGRRAAESRLLAGARRAGQVDDQDRRRQAIQREIESRAAASVPAAFAAGREGAQRQQLAGLQGGAGLIPAGLQGGRGFGTAAAIQQSLADRERQNAMDIAGLFSPFFGSEDLRGATG
jgi:hypothetical protein